MLTANFDLMAQQGAGLALSLTRPPVIDFPDGVL
jgi:hypothetical protein